MRTEQIQALVDSGIPVDFIQSVFDEVHDGWTLKNSFDRAVMRWDSAMVPIKIFCPTEDESALEKHETEILARIAGVNSDGDMVAAIYFLKNQTALLKEINDERIKANNRYTTKATKQ